MTDHITIPRALLEQALEHLDEATTYTSSPSWSPSMTQDILNFCVKLRAELAKPTASDEPFAYTTGVFSGRFTVEPVNRAAVIPEGIALYLHPPTVQHDAPEQQSCKWAFDDDESNTWASGCGELWSFIDGGPAENRVKYCHGCGKPVVLGQAMSRDDKNAAIAKAEGGEK